MKPPSSSISSASTSATSIRTIQNTGAHSLPLVSEIAAGNHRQSLRTKLGARPATDSQLPGPTNLERERIDRRLNRNRLEKNNLVGISVDLQPELLTVVVDQAPLLPPDEAPASLIPSFQDNSSHDGVGAAPLPQGTSKCLTDSQITSDTHSVIPELVTCWARRRLRTISPTASICAEDSVRQLVSVT